jgi:hypothetical protein
MQITQRCTRIQLLFIVCLLFSTVACAQTKGAINATLNYYNFDDSIKRSDLIVEVEILSKDGEITNDPLPKTLFNCSVIRIFKGEVDKEKNNEIIITQLGNEKWIVNGNKLFESGEKYILFLKIDNGYFNTYWISSEEVNIYKIEVIDKKDYVIKNSVKDAKLKDIQNDEIEKIFKQELEKDIDKQVHIKDIQVMEYKAFENLLVDTISMFGGAEINETNKGN